MYPASPKHIRHYYRHLEYTCLINGRRILYSTVYHTDNLVYSWDKCSTLVSTEKTYYNRTLNLIRWVVSSWNGYTHCREWHSARLFVKCGRNSSFADAILITRPPIWGVTNWDIYLNIVLVLSDRLVIWLTTFTSVCHFGWKQMWAVSGPGYTTSSV